MTRRTVTATLTVELPGYDRESFTDMLIAGKTIVPWTTRDLLIDEAFFHSHESDIADAFEERFTPEWRKREYAAAVREAELWRKEALAEGYPEEQLAGCDASSIFKRRFYLEMRHVRIDANAAIAHCWKRLLTRCPQYADRCPWHFFQGDRIWQALSDEAFLRAINHTPLQLAQKMDLNAMSHADWDEVLKIVPELAARRPKEDHDCYVG